MNQPSLIDHTLPDHASSAIEDTQNLQDVRHLDINKVGIKSIRHPVIVKDKSGGEQNTVAVFDMYVHLPHNFKGTHMSRFVEILNTNERAISIESFESILREMVARLEADSGYVGCARHNQIFFYYMGKG